MMYDNKARTTATSLSEGRLKMDVAGKKKKKYMNKGKMLRDKLSKYTGMGGKKKMSY